MEQVPEAGSRQAHHGQERQKILYTGPYRGDRQNNGFPVKPNTVYSFSLELSRERCASVSAWEWNGPGYWKNVKRIKITGK
ncbi:MAG: hypothetical protein V8T87_14115, partial [Victivallales bacterium]